MNTKNESNNDEDAQNDEKSADQKKQKKQNQKKRKSKENPPSASMQIVDFTALSFVALALLPVGGALPVAQAILSGVFVTLFLLAVFHAWLHKQAWRWHPISMVLLLIAAWMLFQASPLSAPFAAPWTLDAYALWPNVEPRIAIAPGRVPLVVLRWIAYAAIVQFWVIRFRKSRKTILTVRAVLIAGLLSLSIGITQVILDMDKILGIYEPVGRSLQPINGVFVNSNQAGALLVLSAIVTISAAWAAKNNSFKALAVSLTLVAGVLTIDLLDARGAFFALICGIVVLFIALVLASSREIRSFGQYMLAGILLVISAFGVRLYMGLAPYIEDIGLSLSNIGKLRAWHSATEVAEHAMLFGFGPLSFPDVFGTVYQEQYHERFSYVESSPLQQVVDIGAPMTILLVLVVIYSMFQWFRQRGKSDRKVALVSLAVGTTIAVEAMTGMGLAAMGYSIPVIALVGVVAARSSKIKQETTFILRPYIGVLTALILVGFTFSGLSDAISIGSKGLYAPLVDMTEMSFEEKELEASRLAALTPGDLALIVNLASLSIRNDPERADQLIAYLQHHAFSSRMTWRLAFIAAFEKEDYTTACEALQTQASFNNVGVEINYILQHPNADLRQWQHCLGEEHSVREIAYNIMHRQRRYAAELAASTNWLREYPDDLTALIAALRSAHALEMPSIAQRYAELVLQNDELDPDLVSFSAKILRLSGRAEIAFYEVSRRISSDPSNAIQRLDRVEILSAMRRTQELSQDRIALIREDLDTTDGQLFGQEQLRQRRLQLARNFYRQEGDLGKQTQILESLARLRPNDVNIVLELGEIAEEQRLRGIARRHYRRALQIDPENATAISRLRELGY